MFIGTWSQDDAMLLFNFAKIDERSSTVLEVGPENQPLLGTCPLSVSFQNHTQF